MKSVWGWKRQVTVTFPAVGSDRHFLRWALILYGSLILTAPAEAAIRYASPSGTGTTCTVTAPCALQTAIDQTAAGDTIIAKDGTYTGTYTLSNAQSGTSAAKITLKAENLHQAVFDGPNGCSANAFTVDKPWWIFSGLRIKEYARAFNFTAAGDNTLIEHSIMEDINYRVADMNSGGTDNLTVRDSVLAFLNRECSTRTTVGAIQVNNGDNLTLINTALIGYSRANSDYFRPDGNLFDRHPPWYTHSGSDFALFQGNLIMGGTGGGRSFASRDPSTVTATGIVFRDNIAAFVGNRAFITDDCRDDGNSWINNIFFKSYGGMFTKGNIGGYGHHTVKNNLVYGNEYTTAGLSFDPSSTCPELAYKQENTFIDNVAYNTQKITNNVAPMSIIRGTGDGKQPPAFSVKGHNLAFAENSTQSGAIIDYLFTGNDLWARPIFNDPANGDLTLHPSSPKYKSSSVADTSPGIAYNTYLRRSVMKHVWNTREWTQDTSQLAQVTFSGLTSGRDYFIWTYTPEPPPTGDEMIFIDGVHRFTAQYDDNAIPGHACCNQPGGPHRWHAAYRHRATNGSMTIRWSRTGYFGQVRLHELPTADEAYAWMNEATSLTGDIDNSGTVDLTDLRLLIQMIVGQVPPNLTTADLDSDGQLTLADVRELINILISP